MLRVDEHQVLIFLLSLATLLGAARVLGELARAIGLPLVVGEISAGLKRLTRRMYSLRLGNWTLIDQVNVVSLVSGVLIIVMGVPRARLSRW